MFNTNLFAFSALRMYKLIVTFINKRLINMYFIMFSLFNNDFSKYFIGVSKCNFQADMPALRPSTGLGLSVRLGNGLSSYSNGSTKLKYLCLSTETDIKRGLNVGINVHSPCCQFFRNLFFFE